MEIRAMRQAGSRRFWRWALQVLVVLAAGLGMGCDGSQNDLCVGGRDEGEVWSDGCNQCSCNSDGSITCTEMACAVTCQREGQTYQPGDAFPAGDGCNVCVCQSDGQVSCTGAACGTSCVYAGVQRIAGSSFPALDGCNTCTCEPLGTVSCTEIACPCNPMIEWWREYVATDPAQCAVIDYTCPPNTTGFENTCGCGCEQDQACAQTYNCTPPNQCDIPKLQTDCPYSQITQ